MEERLPVFLGSNEALHAVSAVESAERWLLVQGSLRNYVRVYCGGRLRPRGRTPDPIGLASQLPKS